MRKLDKIVWQEYPYTDLLKDYAEMITKTIKNHRKVINSFISSHKIRNSSILSNRFLLTKTAQNCLNFLTKKEESDLKQKFNHGNISELLVDVLRIIYILLDKDPNTVKTERLMDNMISNIYNEYGVDNLSKICLNLILESLLFKLVSDYRQGEVILQKRQIRLIKEIVEKNKNVLNYGFVLQQSKAASYITFFLIELYDYYNLKTEDGVDVFDVRNKNIEVERLEKQLCILRNHIYIK